MRKDKCMVFTTQFQDLNISLMHALCRCYKNLAKVIDMRAILSIVAGWLILWCYQIWCWNFLCCLKACFCLISHVPTVYIVWEVMWINLYITPSITMPVLQVVIWNLQNGFSGICSCYLLTVGRIPTKWGLVYLLVVSKSPMKILLLTC
jgi:hypothetical protein